MPGVDYESMLSELGKFGASFILATQSLAKLADISPTMEDTILANVGCLAVFQVSGSDARRLVWELGRERMTEDDITSLPVHHCYVRATVGKERMPAFSMMVKRPEPGDPGVAGRIRAGAARHTTPVRKPAPDKAEEQGAADRPTEDLAGTGGHPKDGDAPGSTGESEGSPRDPRASGASDNPVSPGDDA